MGKLQNFGEFRVVSSGLRLFLGWHLRGWTVQDFVAFVDSGHREIGGWQKRINHPVLAINMLLYKILCYNMLRELLETIIKSLTDYQRCIGS